MVGGEQKEICVCVCVTVLPILIFQLMSKGEREEEHFLLLFLMLHAESVALPDIWRLSVVTCFGKWRINNREFGQSHHTLISVRKMDLSPDETQIWCAQGAKHLSVKGWRQRCGRSLQRSSIANTALGCHYHDRTSCNETQWGHEKDMSFTGDKQLLWVLLAVYTWLLWERVMGHWPWQSSAFQTADSLIESAKDRDVQNETTLHLKEIILILY